MKYVIGGLTRFSDNPASFDVTNYNSETKNMIITYMQQAVAPCGVGGYIDDCKTGEVIHRTNAFYEDDEYLWSDQDIYHVKKYNAAVKPDFIEHVKKKMGAEYGKR